MTSFDDTARVIRSSAFTKAAAGYDRRPLIRLANEIGPGMRLLHWRRLEEIGRLPSFDERATEDAISGISRLTAPLVEIFMVSHRWLRPSTDPALSHPDDTDNTKAKALSEFTAWRCSWVQRRHGFKPEIFFWVDYSCFDQTDIANYLPMLPLWVACCERTLRYETDDYHDRAWCRLELLLSYTFAFADHHVAIRQGFVAGAPDDGCEENHLLLRPTEGVVTNTSDLALIGTLESFAEEFQPASTDRVSGQWLPKADLGRTTIKSYRL